MKEIYYLHPEKVDPHQVPGIEPDPTEPLVTWVYLIDGTAVSSVALIQLLKDCYFDN